MVLAIGRPVIALAELIADVVWATAAFVLRVAAASGRLALRLSRVVGRFALRLGRTIGRPVRDHLWRPARKLPGAIHFALFDWAASGGAVRARIREIKQLGLDPEEEAFRTAKTMLAYGYYPHALESFPDSPRGVASRIEAQMEASLAHYARSNPKVLHEFMLDRINEGRTGVAERVCRQAAEAGLTEARVFLGDILRVTGRVDEAQSEYLKAADRGIPYALRKLGELRQAIGDLDGAGRALQEAVRRGDRPAEQALADLAAAAKADAPPVQQST
ncbi:MAG TPA: hypothetical protein VF520_03950 [Thermoleophilaceae bacterium]|jgi:tetratricopeptide (TPR) repeat protein